MSDVTSLESGDGTGHRVTVNARGRAGSETVEAPWTVARSVVTVQTTSTSLAAARPGRRGLRVAVLGANPVFLRFDGAAASAQDWPVAALAQLALDHFPCESLITAIAVGGSSQVLVLEMAEEEP